MNAIERAERVERMEETLKVLENIINLYGAGYSKREIRVLLNLTERRLAQLWRLLELP